MTNEDNSPVTSRAFNLAAVTLARMAECGRDRKVLPDEIRAALHSTTLEQHASEDDEQDAGRLLLRMYLEGSEAPGVRQ